MVESDIELVLTERDIKTFAVVADNNFVSLNVFDKMCWLACLTLGWSIPAIRLTTLTAKFPSFPWLILPA